MILEHWNLCMYYNLQDILKHGFDCRLFDPEVTTLRPPKHATICVTQVLGPIRSGTRSNRYFPLAWTPVTLSGGNAVNRGDVWLTGDIGTAVVAPTLGRPQLDDYCGYSAASPPAHNRHYLCRHGLVTSVWWNKAPLPTMRAFAEFSTRFRGLRKKRYSGQDCYSKHHSSRTSYLRLIERYEIIQESIFSIIITIRESLLKLPKK